MHSLSSIASVLGIELPAQEDRQITELVTDSRKIYFPHQTLYFALRGATTNGHQYISKAYENGIRAFVVEEILDADPYPGAIFLLQEDSLLALQKIAAWHRTEFSLTVIGITGSNGKTIVKELLFQLLYQHYSIVRSPRSYNSQLGVPLSVWNIGEANTLGIFEAGISRTGEMAKLQSIIQPQMGIVTFIGDAHAGGFSSVEEKIKEKLKLFSRSAILFYCADEKLLDAEVHSFVSTENPALELFSWSRQPGTPLQILYTKIIGSTTEINCSYHQENFSFTIPFTDEASIHNCITCCCVLLHLGVEIFSLQKKMEALRPVGMRLELKKGKANCSIINDSYNSDINSVSIALQFLAQQQQHEARSIIISDVFQSAHAPLDLYQHIAKMVSRLRLKHFIGIGYQLKQHAHLFHGIEKTSFFDSSEEFIRQMSSFHFRDETILLKGARVFEFEKISRLLELQTHQTVLEINLDALRSNLLMYRQQLNPGVKMMLMVKAFSYGSGSYEIAGLLQQIGVDYLAVAYTDEGITLRQNGITLPIMVLNVDENAFESLLEYQLEPEMFGINIFRSFSHFLQNKSVENYKVHIKLDTGMHRLGFTEDNVDELCTELSSSTTVKVASAFSHLAASDNPDEDPFTKEQFRIFAGRADKIEAATGHSFLRHISNTSGISRFPDLQLDMVRLGIGLYGVDSNEDMQKKLEVVTTLRSTIAQIKEVKKGESVGYGRQYKLENDATIAVVRIGYADGFRRVFGNGVGKFWVNGHLCPIAGNVCMDMTMIDVTGINVAEEDEVIIFGKELPVQQLATWSNTIPYEIFTDISQRVQRVYYQE